MLNKIPPPFPFPEYWPQIKEYQNLQGTSTWLVPSNQAFYPFSLTGTTTTPPYPPPTTEQPQSCETISEPLRFFENQDQIDLENNEEEYELVLCEEWCEKLASSVERMKNRTNCNRNSKKGEKKKKSKNNKGTHQDRKMKENQNVQETIAIKKKLYGDGMDTITALEKQLKDRFNEELQKHHIQWWPAIPFHPQLDNRHEIIE